MPSWSPARPARRRRGRGDTVAALHAYGLPERQIDLALVPDFWLMEDEFRSHVDDGIGARFVVPMHYSHRSPPRGIETRFANAVVFHDTIESWVVPGTSGTAPAATSQP